MRKLLLFFLFIFITVAAYAQTYNVSEFGIKGDSVTLNTRSIQKAIDYVSSHGGGQLVFDQGKYITGSIYLKSNVILNLEAGATLLGSTNPFDYPIDSVVKWKSLIYSIEQKNVGITGRGMIDGRGFRTAMNSLNMVYRGLIKDELLNDRVREPKRPENLYFYKCDHIIIKGITLKNSASWNQTYNQCSNLLVDHISVDNKSYWNNDGIDIVDSKHVVIRDSYFDAADDVLCLKSFDTTKMCEDVLIEHCVARSSANALKFGTGSRGGFKDITVRNLTVYDTYRSAIALEAVDGGIVENVLIDSVRAINTGNIIFLRIGNRNSQGRTPSMKNITIENVYAEVAFKKPDAGYRYEGPVEDLPRNISPCSIAGLPQYKIKNVLLKNIEIVYPGGGNPNYAYAGLSPKDLDSIPEMPAAYPEFSQFKELPAWGFFIRHAEDIHFNNVTVRAKRKDYRPAIVMDDVNGIDFKNVKILEPNAGHKKQIFSYKSQNVKGN